MNRLNPLLPFSELSEQNQAEILREMSREDYDSQYHIYLLSQKMKQSQVGLAPKKELKAQLLAELRPTLSSRKVWLNRVAIAATLVGFVFAYFILQKTDNQIVIQEKTIQPIAKVQPNTTLLELKKEKRKKKKTVKKASKFDIMQANEEDITATFHRHNPNLVWQNEEEEDSNMPLPPLVIFCEK